MEKYLVNYAEPEIAALEELPGNRAWTNVLVVPACNETAGLLRPLPPSDGRSLMILVINESPLASQDVSSANRALAAEVRTRFTAQWQTSAAYTGFELSLFRDPLTPRDLLLVDRFSAGRQLPQKGGVGHARKIGADLAACLVGQGRILSPWIHCSDGDVQLPETYFTCTGEEQLRKQDYAALVYPFRHCGNRDTAENRTVTLATQLYELSLRYYLAGMKFARSPYAFHTIGSTMAVNATHYAKVRGFPKREAGEDFYLLNKLAKVGPVLELAAGPSCEPISIQARRSDRVPFGTGAAVNTITAMSDPVRQFRFYNPDVFPALQLWLQSLPAIWTSGSSHLNAGCLPDENCLRGQSSTLLSTLERMGAGKALEHAFRQSRSLDQFTRQMHTWFDAFRTLKLVHHLRDQFFPSIPHSGLIANEIYRHLLTQDRDLREFHEQLQQDL